MSKRYVLEYVPKADVEALIAKHPREMADGASVWDICPPEHMTKEREARTEADALIHAKILVPLDEFGEVHVFEQETQDFGRRKTWEITRRAVVYGDEEALDWEAY